MTIHDSKSNALTETVFGSQARTDALAPPEPRNEDGKTQAETSETSLACELPRLVTRGESLYNEITGEDGESYVAFVKNHRIQLIHLPKPKIDGVANAAVVDYLNCTFPFSGRSAINDFFAELLPILGNNFSPAVDRCIGKYGYEHSFKLGISSALFAYGGNNGTGFLSMSGEACQRIADWERLVNYLSDTLKAKITRWDGAYDDFEGIHSVDNALRMYREGLFTNGGNKPLMDQRGNWDEPDGRGRTLYIGSSDNGKLLRVYEKGMQLGIPFHPWVRWETQLGNRDRIIPWEAVLEPGKYLAGSYRNAMSWICEEQSRIRTSQKTVDIGYKSLNHWASIAYGKHINLMMHVEGSAEKVVELLRRSGLPKRLDLPELPNYGRVLP